MAPPCRYHVAFVQLAIVAAMFPVAVSCLRLAFVSDMHYDPFYGGPDAYTMFTPTCATTRAKLGLPGCDSPLSLLVSAFDDVARAGKPEYVVLGGDWERHHTVPESASEAFRMLSDVVVNFTLRAVPCPGLTPLGNNDFVPNYAFDMQSPPPLMGQIAHHLSNAGMLRDDERGTFSTAGFYARRIPQASLTILVLNTLIWTDHMLPRLATGDDPLGQFAFAAAVIAAARRRQEKVLLLSHIPMTVNVFGAVRDAAVNMTEALEHYFMQPQYEATYAELLRNSSDVLVAQVFSHTHRFSFSASVDMGSVPLIILGAISPVYGNNPNYFIADYDPKLGRLTRMQQRYLPISTKGDSAAWTWGYTLPDAYGTVQHQQQIDSRFMLEVARKLERNASARSVYRRMHMGLDREFVPFFWHLVTCFAQFAIPERAFACALQAEARAEKISAAQTLLVKAMTVVSALTVVLSVVAAAVVIYRQRFPAALEGVLFFATLSRCLAS